ncbi:helix-turn-helix domain-containing protein [Nocardia sp. NPDC050712]|uniref:helix-turn-helix domain-containing protein n=1 Tax=Nocardia sp. NPDC050712 TaxID=3155518 RepID=UPI0033F8A018
MQSSSQSGWLQLLLEDAPWPALMRYRGVVREQAGTAGDLDADAALELRAKLDQRRHRAAELSALNDLAVRLTAVRDPGALLQIVVEQARGLLQVDLAYVATLAGDEFVVEVTSGALSTLLPGMRFPREEGLAGVIRRTRASAWTQDYQADPNFRHRAGADSAAAAENMRGLLGVPLLLGDQVLGALFACKRTERQFNDSETRLLAALAAHAAVAIDNARSFAGYQRSVERLERANAELSTRTAQLEKAIEWDRTLAEVVLRGGGVAQLVADAGRLMGKPVHLVTDAATMPAELEAVGAAVAEVVTGLASGALDRSEVVVVPAAAGSAAQVIAQCIHTEDRFLGALLVRTAGDTEFTEADRLLLGRAAPAVALLLAADHYAGEASRRARDAFVVDLVTRPAATAEDDRRQCRLAGVAPDRRYCVVVTEAGGAGGRLPDSVAWPSGTVVAQHGSRAIALVPGEDPGAVAALLPAAVTSGVSDAAAGAAGLSAAYLEAQQTCDVLLTLGRAGETCAAADLGIYRILLTHSGRRQLDRLAERLLGPLLAEEAKRGTPLVDTLSAYLGHGRRHAETAAALTIHVNTLYQRLDTVDRLLGTGWRQPDAALDLQVVLRLRRSAVLLA